MTKMYKVQGDKIIKNLFTSKKAAFTLAEGATHVGICNNIRKSAFTLAEVLITLAIIGVVAAMTIPTLTQNYKKKVVETKLLKFYSTMNQAIKLSEIDNGKLTTWDPFTYNEGYDSDEKYYIETTNALEWWNKYFANYVKTAKVVKPEKDREGNLFVYFSDGSMVSFGFGSWLYYPNANDYSEQVVTDDYTKRDTSVCGTKYFTFYFNPHRAGWKDIEYHLGKGLEPYAIDWDGTEEMLKEHSSVGCNVDAKNEPAYCAKLIQLNGWKIPDDYPFKF